MRSIPRGTASVLFLLAVGMHGLAVQVVLVRELMASAAGNELVAGVVLAVWMAAEAGGAWLSGRFAPDQADRGFWLLVPTAVLSSVAAVPGVPVIQSLIGVLPGEVLDVPRLLAVAALAVAVPASSHGAIFVLAVVRHAALGGHDRIGPGYVWEGLGTAVAAPAVWLLLLRRTGSFAVAAGFGAAMLLAAAVLLRGRRSRRAVFLGAAFVLLTAVPASGPIERWAAGRHWRGHEVLEAGNSLRGKIVRLERQGQREVFYNGVLAFADPAANLKLAEELVHLGLLHHPSPGEVAVIGSRPDLLPLVLSHPVNSVTIVVQDPALLDVVRSAADSAVLRALSDARVRIVTGDPRRFLRGAPAIYDAIILPEAAPLSLGANRLFSAEFYALCRDRLSDGGVLVLPGPGSPGAVGPITNAVVETRLRTLGMSFPHVELLAADLPVFVASVESVDVTPGSLADRLDRRGIAAAVLDASYVASLLDEFRQQRSRPTLNSPDICANTDDVPRELLLAMARETLRMSPWCCRLDRWIAGVRPSQLLGFGLVFLIVSVLIPVVTRRRPDAGARVAAITSVATTGFVGAAMVAVAVPLFEVRFGSVYTAVSLLLSAFMFGCVAGGWLGTSVTAPGRRAMALLRASEVAMLLFTVAAAVLVNSVPVVPFLVLLALVGAGVGFQFPVAGALIAVSSGGRRGLHVGRRAGVLVATDLAGGLVGAVGASLLLVPTYGFAVTLTVLVVAKIGSAVGPLLQPGTFDISGSAA